MPKGKWKPETRARFEAEKAKRAGLSNKTVSASQGTIPKETPKVEPVSTQGNEIIPEVVSASAENSQDPAPNNDSTEAILDLTDEELKEILALLFKEGLSLPLKWLKRQLVTDSEAATFGKISFPFFKVRLKDKLNLGWAGPAIYAMLVILSKDLTPEGERLKQEKQLELKRQEELKRANTQEEKK